MDDVTAFLTNLPCQSSVYVVYALQEETIHVLSVDVSSKYSVIRDMRSELVSQIAENGSGSGRVAGGGGGGGGEAGMQLFVSHAFSSAATQSASVASAGSPRLRRRSASFTTGEAAHRSAFGRGHHCGTPVRVIGLPMGWLQLLLLLLLPLQTAFAACAVATAAALAACPP